MYLVKSYKVILLRDCFRSLLNVFNTAKLYLHCGSLKKLISDFQGWKFCKYSWFIFDKVRPNDSILHSVFTRWLLIEELCAKNWILLSLETFTAQRESWMISLLLPMLWLQYFPFICFIHFSSVISSL